METKTNEYLTKIDAEEIRSMDSLIENFIRTFIVKNKRKRTRFQLLSRHGGFINKLNHGIEGLFDMRKLSAVEADARLIRNKLKVDSKTKCYVLCHDDSIDDSILNFNLAFDHLFGNGLAFCLIIIGHDSIYLEGEYVKGSTERYIGIQTTEFRKTDD